MSDKESVLTKLTGLFSNKVKPEKLIDQLRKQTMTADETLAGIEYDLKRESVKLQQTVNKGTEAVRKGLTGEKIKWATRLKVARSRVAQLTQQQMMVAKSQCVAEIALSKLEFTAPEGRMKAVRDIHAILSNHKVKNLLMDADVNYQTFQKEMDKMFDIENSRLNDDVGISMEGDEDIKLLEELARAEDKGDKKKAVELNQQLTRSNPVAEESDSFLNSL